MCDYSIQLHTDVCRHGALFQNRIIDRITVKFTGARSIYITFLSAL